MYPPGPFPPHGHEKLGDVDLGIRVRDLFFRRDLLVGPVRQILVDHLQAAAQIPGRFALAMSSVDALLDTWPLASMIDDAVQDWSDGPSASALAVLSRCAEVVAPAVGWPLSIDRRWPMPDVKWIRDSAGTGPFVVIGRGPRDAAPAVAVALDSPLGPIEHLDLPPVVIAQGDELVDRLDDFLGALERGDAVAFRFDTPVPWDPASRAALATLHAAAPLQRSFEIYGHAALQTGPVPAWKDMLLDAPEGIPSTTPSRLCDAIVLPMMDGNGVLKTVGALLWEAPFKSVSIDPAGVEVLRRLDGDTTAAQIASAVGSPEDNIVRIVEQLVELGAATG